MKTYRQKHPYIAQIGYILGTSCNGSHGCSRSRIADTFVCSANIMTHADRRAKTNEHEICNEK